MIRRYAPGLLVTLLSVALLSPPGAAAAEWPVVPAPLDKGGFSVDFWKAGAIPSPSPGENLLSNGGMETVAAGHPQGWQKGSYVWLAVSDAARHRRIQARAAPEFQWQTCDKSAHIGAGCMRLAIARAAYDPGETSTHEICAFYHQSCLLPEPADSKKYILLFHHRGEVAADVPYCRSYARITFLDEKGQQTRVYAQSEFLPASRWRKGFLQFVVPKTTRRLDVRLALTGCGEVCFDDVSLYPAPIQEKGTEVRLMPWYYLDNRYCLSSADAGVIVFGFRNEQGGKIGRPQLLVELPEGVEILDLAAGAKHVEQRPVQLPAGPGRQHRIDISAWKSRIHDDAFRYPFNMWDGVALLLTTSLPPSEIRLPARYWLEDGDYRTKPLSFEIQIVPPITKVVGPKTFRSGAVLFLVQEFQREAGVRAFADLYEKVGFNSVHVAPSRLCAEMRPRGIERYNQPLANGYMMGDARPGVKPPEAVFRLADGKPQWEAICPVEVYRRGNYFRSRIENDLLRKILVTDRHAEQIMANWEPYMYNGQGCFCNRCKEEFKAFSKLPSSEVDRVWPKLVAREHREAWLKFRSWQHGKLMTTLEETVHALGKEAGLDAHFIPEIHYGLLTNDWDRSEENREYAAVDYLGKLPVLNPWAPYNWYIFTNGPYDYLRGERLRTHITACDVREFVASRLPEGNRPRLIAFPYGTYEGATQPEALAFEFLSYYLDGYGGAFAYLFPGGYDARYWRALAEANRQIAQFESFVTKGRPMKKHRLEWASPLPKPDRRVFALGQRQAEKWKGLPLVLSWEFERGDARLIAVGNFWEQGESFFRLAVDGLDSGRKYVVREPLANRIYGDPTGAAAMAGVDLAKGILLHLGAMRYGFFVVEPYRASTGKAIMIRPQEMEAALRERLPGIERASCDDR